MLGGSTRDLTGPNDLIGAALARDREVPAQSLASGPAAGP